MGHVVKRATVGVGEVACIGKLEKRDHGAGCVHVLSRRSPVSGLRVEYSCELLFPCLRGKVAHPVAAAAQAQCDDGRTRRRERAT